MHAGRIKSIRICAKNKKEIILPIENCKDPFIVPEMKAVKLDFLPLNTTSKLQPLDQKITRSFKIGYRKDVVKKIVDVIDGERQITSLNTLDLHEDG